MIAMDASTRHDLVHMPRDAVAEFLAGVALMAGPAIMEEYGSHCVVRGKADESPVTAADENAEAIILTALRAQCLPIPIIAEESAARGDLPAIDGGFILVDPLDGTREFITRNGEFTVNIALIREGVAIAGAVYAPALGRLWYGGERAFACQAPIGASGVPEAGRRQIYARAPDPKALVALASRSHLDSKTEAFLERLRVTERRSVGSSLKFCTIAEGTADVYPRFAPTMEWDTAAGDAVLRAAGGVVRSVEHGELRYGKHGFLNGGFVAFGDHACAAAAMGA
jgi:3'(2'), 5'-bisphosphate nucleotidase